MKKVFFIVVGLLGMFLFTSLTFMFQQELVQMDGIGYDAYSEIVREVYVG